MEIERKLLGFCSSAPVLWRGKDHGAASLGCKMEAKLTQARPHGGSGPLLLVDLMALGSGSLPLPW